MLSTNEDTYLNKWEMRRQRTELHWEIVEHPLAHVRLEDLRHHPCWVAPALKQELGERPVFHGGIDA